MRANQLTWMLLASLLACGDDERTAPDAQVVSDASRPAPACVGTQIRCRGHCFQNAGEVVNGCEMLLGAKDDLRTVDLVGGALYAVSNDGVVKRRIMRVGSEGAQTVAPLPDDTRPEQVQLADGFAYYLEGAAIQRVSLMGGSAQRVADRRAGAEAQFAVRGAHLYSFGENEQKLPLQRTPVAGGATENVGAFANVAAIVLDASDYYVFRSFPDGTFVRFPQSDPTSVENVTYTPTPKATLMLWPQDPTHVYFFVEGKYKRFDKVALGVEDVALANTEESAGKQGSDHFFVQEATSIRGRRTTRTVGIRWDGQTDVVDEDGDAGDITEDAQYYYLVRRGALFRVAR